MRRFAGIRSAADRWQAAIRLGLSASLAASLAVPAIAQPAAGGERPPTPVTVVTIEPRDITLTSLLPGRVTASAIAEVRPQVSGIVTEVLYEDGSEVEKGAPLYQIDADSYEAQKAAADAALAQAKAQQSIAERELERQDELLRRSVASQQNLDEAQAQRDVAAAAVKVAEANLRTAEIDLRRTTITAPITGIAGISRATQGSLVTAGQATALAVIRNIDTVYVDVKQSAAEILRWRRNGTALPKDADPTVALRLADGGDYEHEGRINAAEPYVDEETGVILLRLEFPNPDRLLLPGMYVQVEVPHAVVENALLVPQDGVSRDRRGQPTAMVVNGENVVELRHLTIQRDQGSYWIVTSGIAAGEKVVVAGLQKIAPGVTVKPEERPNEAETEQLSEPHSGDDDQPATD